ncbi:MAG: hypothetical protein PHW33_02145 [Candidatus Portnoybacteria bacterium]|nr:hypothetical protein [Candidatus Portnoybacteria bacterium]
MKKYLGLFVGLAMLAPAVAGAAEFKSGETVAVGETVRENVYAAGSMVNIAGTVEGDLYVVGGTVNLMGTVTKDVVVLGGTLVAIGKIGEDLRIGGGNVTVGGTIGGELTAAGGNLNVMPGAQIGGDTSIGAGNVSFNGSVGGDLIIGGGEIVLGSSAKVAGDFEYYSQKEAKIDAAAKVNGKTTFHEQVAKKAGKPSKAPVFAFFAFVTFWGLIGLAGAIILSCLLFYTWPKDSKEMIARAFASPGRELVRGFVILISLPIAAIICMITLVGLPVGFFALVAFFTLIILGGATTGVIWAAVIAKFVFRRKETEINWWLIAVGALILALIKLIPIAGWIVAFLVFLVGLGVLSRQIYSKLAPEK